MRRTLEGLEREVSVCVVVNSDLCHRQPVTMVLLALVCHPGGTEEEQEEAASVQKKQKQR